MLTIFGTIALDTTRTLFHTEERIMGGAATYAALAASKYIPTNIVGVVGYDFPNEHKKTLIEKIDTKGIVYDNKKKTFHFDSTFNEDFSIRTANKTELNVIENFEPIIPDEYKKSRYVYLANNDPIQNLKILELFEEPKLIIFDTIRFWIENKYHDIFKMFKKVNGVIINDEEAKLLTKNYNLLKCGQIIKDEGPEFVVIKKGEHGSLLFYNDMIFTSPAFPIKNIVDPTGAGDCFAGGFLGYIAKTGKVNEEILRKAVVNGNLMGSFAVEEFGIKKILNINENDISKRYQQYIEYTKF